MSSAPLMKSEDWSAEDDYNDAGGSILDRQKARLSRKDGRFNLIAVLLAAIVSLAVGVAIGMALSTRGEGLSLAQSMAPSPVTRDLDISFHNTQFEGSFMDENIYRLKANNETDAAWEALGINCKSGRLKEDCFLGTDLRS